jgi:hypothetical protein
MTVNHWVPGSSPGRGAKIQSLRCKSGAFLYPPDSHQGLRPRLFGKPHPFGAALKRVLLRSRVQVAEPNQSLRCKSGAFFASARLSPGTTSQVIRQASPLRGRAEARSAAQSSPGRGANFKAPGDNLGLFVSAGLSRPCRRQLAGDPRSAAAPNPHYPLIASKLAPTKSLTCKGLHKALSRETKTPRIGGAFSLYGSAYCASVFSADSPASASDSAAGAASFSSPLMPSSSRSKTSTELAGISGLGLCSP